MLREMRHYWCARREGRGGMVQLSVHNDNNIARGWYERLGLEPCRWWEKGGACWVLQGEGLYTPEEPNESTGAAGGKIMRIQGRVLDKELQSRQGRRGDRTADIRYLTVTGGVDELRGLGLLDGVRAMANRVYAGQSWWVEGHRSSIECLYRKQSRACPTMFVIAIAAGTANTEHVTRWEETEQQGERATGARPSGSDGAAGRPAGKRGRWRTGDG